MSSPSSSPTWTVKLPPHPPLPPPITLPVTSNTASPPTTVMTPPHPPLPPEITLPDETKTASLYVGDLDPEVTQMDLTRLFGRVGPLNSVRLCRNRDYPFNSLCYAYVNFIYPPHASEALEALNYYKLKGKSMRIMWSQRDPLARKNGVANLYVKNLDSSITNARLHTIFSKYGTILSCKVAEENGKSKGFGFVQFDFEDSALSAIAALHQSFLEGKQLYVSKFIKKSERENTCEKSNFTNLYVKYLSEDVTEDVLRERFSEYGNISSVVIMKDSAGVSKGFGFVGFNLHEDAKKAMEALNGAVIGSNKLYVGKAQRKAERKDQLVYANKELLNYHTQKLKASNLFVKNLNISIDDRKLEHIFGAYGKVTSARVMCHYNGFSKGFGFVNFSTVEEAKMALDSLNGTIVEGTCLHVTAARSREERRKNWQDCFALLPPSLYTPNYSGFPSPNLAYSYSAPFISNSVSASRMNSSQKNTNQYATSTCTFAAHSYQGTEARSYQGSYTTYMPMGQSQEVTTTKKVSSNHQYPGPIAKVSAMHLEKNKYGTQKMSLSQRSLVAEVGKAVKVRDAYSQSGTYGGAKPDKFVRCLNY
ncbi:polyadenylate-binding protein 6-like [Apium graveolens]|uniref:polyadenylate-binding protein 6-like n=1 Tax=Apium graveolens TaxID=4045 RepID=UPI003D7A58D8